MALFTDSRELDRQESVANLRPSSGSDKAWTAALGYDEMGQLNTWGKINPFVGGGVTGAIASKINKGNDAGVALKASQGEAWKHTLDKAKFGVDLLTMGGGSAATNALSKGIDLIKGGSGTSIGGIVKGLASKKNNMDKLDNGGEVGPGGVDSFGDAVLTDNPAEDGLTAEGIQKFNEFMADNPDGTREMFEESVKGTEGMSDLFQGGKGLVAGLDKLQSSGALDAIGGGVGAITSGVGYAKALEDNRVTDGKKQMNTFNYL